jgi:hypothetical protein
MAFDSFVPYLKRALVDISGPSAKEAKDFNRRAHQMTRCQGDAPAHESGTEASGQMNMS